MIDFLQMITSGIAVGSTYALMGIAMVIIYKASEVPNFAQGEMALISSTACPTTWHFRRH
jgi:branched-chain amino acid transport system permease protein